MKGFRQTLIALAMIGAGFTPMQAADTEKEEWPMSAFAWGADVASSIDLTGQDLSTFNIAAALGYKNSAIQMLGIGAEIDIAVNNPCRLYPVYALIRTSFVPRPCRCFFEAKMGYSFNRMPTADYHNGLYASASWGINLAMSKNFRSYFTLGYTYHQLKAPGFHDLSAVTTGIGISF